MVWLRMAFGAQRLWGLSFNGFVSFWPIHWLGQGHALGARPEELTAYLRKVFGQSGTAKGL